MSTNWAQALPNPEAYWIGRVMFDTQHKPDHMARFKAEPEAYLSALPLTDRAKKALMENDIGRLYVLGANPYLIRAHFLALKIPESDFLGALRAVSGEVNANG